MPRSTETQEAAPLQPKSVVIAIPMMENPKADFFRTFLVAYTKLLSETYREGSLFKDWKVYLNLEQENFLYLAMNRMVEKTLSAKADYLVKVDDDMVLPPETLTRILTKLVHGYHVVAPVMYQKHPPFKTVIWSMNRDEGTLHQLDGIPDGWHGMLETEATGFGVVGLSSYILKKIPEPWFEIGSKGSEDLLFCAKVKELKEDVWVDLDLTVGHLGISLIDQHGPRAV